MRMMMMMMTATIIIRQLIVKNYYNSYNEDEYACHASVTWWCPAWGLQCCTGILLPPGCFNYLTTTYKVNNSHRPALDILLSLTRGYNVPVLVSITPRRSQKHGCQCIAGDRTSVAAGGRILLLLFHLYNSLHSLKLDCVVWVNGLWKVCPLHW